MMYFLLFSISQDSAECFRIISNESCIIIQRFVTVYFASFCVLANAARKFRSEAWALKKREQQRLEAAQMKFLRHLLGITKLDKEKNQCIREKKGARNIVKEIKQYQQKWLQHVQRMDANRIPKQALQYRPKGRRNIGRPKKRWRDQLYFEDQGTGNTPNPSGT